jgi:ferredoxin-like protein FixX
MRQAVAACRTKVRGKMKSVNVKEEGCMGCGLCRVHCQTAHSRSKDFIKAFEKESPRPLLLSSNGDLGGKVR